MPCLLSRAGIVFTSPSTYFLDIQLGSQERRSCGQVCKFISVEVGAGRCKPYIAVCVRTKVELGTRAVLLIKRFVACHMEEAD
jgi:hypothetical protein